MSAAAESAPRLMMLSIHPSHVAHILRGDKTVELRRTKPAVEPGQPVAIYATTPTSAVVATSSITAVDADTPAAIWDRHGAASMIDQAAFDEYFRGASVAVAMRLGPIDPLSEQLPLRHMRRDGPFNPPQTWHFLSPERVEQLAGCHPAHGELARLVMP
jgi:predicted transcriptional regulator